MTSLCCSAPRPRRSPDTWHRVRTCALRRGVRGGRRRRQHRIRCRRVAGWRRPTPQTGSSSWRPAQVRRSMSGVVPDGCWWPCNNRACSPTASTCPLPQSPEPAPAASVPPAQTSPPCRSSPTKDTGRTCCSPTATLASGAGRAAAQPRTRPAGQRGTRPRRTRPGRWAHAGVTITQLRLRVGGDYSAPFRWATVGVDAIARLADDAGLRLLRSSDTPVGASPCWAGSGRPRHATARRTASPVKDTDFGRGCAGRRWRPGSAPGSQCASAPPSSPGCGATTRSRRPDWLTMPTRPVNFYRVTQGLHIVAGSAAVPLLLVKLWSVTRACSCRYRSGPRVTPS